ncbi:MAG: flagellar assembly protein FliW [Deltaproteobacteria bacterium]|nr:flagellar assembly protein FliW [Deltaproteobacteria bacterium]
MIRIEGTKFGAVEVDETAVIRFPNGLVGFPAETEFVLLERSGGKLVGYLQSLRTPGLAFPVMDAAQFDGYPEPSLSELASGAGLPTDDLAVLVIVSVNPQTKLLQANLLAPLLVHVASRTAAQCVLDPQRFSATHTLADPIALAKARMEAAKARLAEGDAAAKVAAGA